MVTFRNKNGILRLLLARKTKNLRTESTKLERATPVSISPEI